MNKQNVTNFINSAKNELTKRSPEILTGIGIAGMVTTTVLAVKATPKAIELIEDEKRSQNYELCKEAERLGNPTCSQIGKLKPIEVVKIAWKPYVPAMITGTVSIACLIGASSVNARRNAALATAYQLSATALSEYKEQVVETIGEKREKTIREKVAQKKLDDNPIDTSKIIVTGSGDVLFVEPVSMRTFTSDVQKVREIINDLNERMMVGMEEYISLSEFYDELGLSRTNISDDIGWNLGKDGAIKCEFHACVTDDGKPAFMLDYHIAPRRDFMNLM